jgi:DNA polymerase-3 subunit gamma/tau
MSYLVLARKWRPKDFADTVGQEHVLQALINALDSGRLHHAYLFTGTRGVGKTTIARILAKALNCEKGVTSEPCGECSACVEIDEGRFVDLIEVDAASKTKVDDTRDLLDNVQYAPARGRYKVYLIDEVHMLSKSSFNALLKTLEEPPPHVKFLLATTDPQKLPVTVLSRCLQFNLKRMTPHSGSRNHRPGRRWQYARCLEPARPSYRILRRSDRRNPGSQDAGDHRSRSRGPPVAAAR